MEYNKESYCRATRVELGKHVAIDPAVDVSLGALSDGRISETVAQLDWSDYYDHISSRRTALSTFFTEWIEY